MTRTVAQPVVTKTDKNETITTHPAFGKITVSRTAGNAHLYCSDFQHQHYISLNISRSYLRRDLSQDWVFGGEELIEVSLSEAQWASMLSSMNLGMGTACTIDHVNGEQMPLLPRPEAAHRKFKEELEANMQEMQTKLKEIASGLDAAISKGKAAQLKKELELLSHRLTGSTGFVASQFDEHIENTIEAAKIEINAHALNSALRLGIQDLDTAAPAITYHPGSDEASE